MRTVYSTYLRVIWLLTKKIKVLVANGLMRLLAKWIFPRGKDDWLGNGLSRGACPEALFPLGYAWEDHAPRRHLAFWYRISTCPFVFGACVRRPTALPSECHGVAGQKIVNTSWLYHENTGSTLILNIFKFPFQEVYFFWFINLNQLFLEFIYVFPIFAV